MAVEICKFKITSSRWLLTTLWFSMSMSMSLGGMSLYFSILLFLWCFFVGSSHDCNISYSLEWPFNWGSKRTLLGCALKLVSIVGCNGALVTVSKSVLDSSRVDHNKSRHQCVCHYFHFLQLLTCFCSAIFGAVFMYIFNWECLWVSMPSLYLFCFSVQLFFHYTIVQFSFSQFLHVLLYCLQATD